MRFISYCMHHELPFIGSEYEIISDGENFAYIYDIDESRNLAIYMDENSYAVFKLDENEVNDDLHSKIDEVRRFYRETKGQQTKHLSQDTIRCFNIIFRMNSVITDNDFTSIDSTLYPLNFEKRQLKKDGITCWGIYYNNIPIFHLNREDLVDRIFDVMKSDLTSYIMQRWKRHK